MQHIILKLKEELKKRPESIIFGKINAGNPLVEEHGIYYDFLKISDGLRAGSIDLWSYKDLARNQYMLSDLTGCLCIGQVDYVPLVLKQDSDDVYIFNGELEKNRQWIFISNFNDFIINYVSGIKYDLIVPDCKEDLWYKFIKTVME